MARAEVKTNIDPKDVNDALLETFQKWVNFSLGIGKLGGRILRHPSGRMASAIKAESDPDGNVVAIYIDKDTMGSSENDFLIHGHKGFSLKQRMLKAGKPGVKRSKKGNLYRHVRISDSPASPRKSFASALNIKNLFTGQKTQQGGVFGINKNLAKMWVSGYNKTHRNSGKIRTMSYKPGSARWFIPAMPGFNISKLLRESLSKEIRDRVII